MNAGEASVEIPRNQEHAPAEPVSQLSCSPRDVSSALNEEDIKVTSTRAPPAFDPKANVRMSVARRNRGSH